MADNKTATETILTGVEEIDEQLCGGIPAGSLGLIEGQPSAGKSVLCQHLTSNTLRSQGSAVAYYTTENSVRGLITQMDSLSLHSLDHFLTDRLRIYPLVWHDDLEDTGKPLRVLCHHIASLPKHFRLVIVDTITLLAAHSSPAPVLDFLLACKEICGQGRIVLLVVDSHTFGRETLSRAISLCDFHLRLRLEEVGCRLMSVLEVPKMRGARPFAEKDISFEVKPKLGICKLPYSKARATAV